MSAPPRHPLEPVVAALNSMFGRAVSYFLVAVGGSSLGLSIALKELHYPLEMLDFGAGWGLIILSFASPPAGLALFALGVGFIVYVRFNLRLRFLLYALLVAALQGFFAGHWEWFATGGGGGLS